MGDVERAARAAAPALAITTVIQQDRLGTGHAVKQAKPALAGHRGDVVVLFGDTPLVTTETLRRLVRRVAAPVMPPSRRVSVRSTASSSHGWCSMIVAGSSASSRRATRRRRSARSGSATPA